jgi:transposase InsO family protein
VSPLPVDDACTPLALSATRAPANDSFSRPFVFDTGATCHISPDRSDFKSLRAIPPFAVKGLGGSCVYAIGIGDIDLTILKGCKLRLHDVLFIPTSTIRLISVLALNRSGRYSTHFDSNSCWVSGPNNAVIARGSVSADRSLYVLSTVSAPLVSHLPATPSPQAFVASRVPDLATWHNRLGHCAIQTILDMAQNRVADGMPIDLSSSAPKCEHCILGKQTRSSVPKLREGPKATARLERIFMDLTGPMSVQSRSGRMYSMNIIDDFSSYIWSLPLRSKGEAASILQHWHRAVTNQTGDKLKIMVTDNGELVSNITSDWCSTHGIDHQRTAPHTSLQNGRAERLHRTIMCRARTMRLACDAPPNMWDEFCATAAYLTNLTATSSLNGKTPFELWHGRRPSLSHL